MRTPAPFPGQHGLDAPGRRSGSLAFLLACAVVAASCGDRPEPALELSVEELPSPAEEWSAQPRLATTDSGVILSWLETRADAEGRETTLLMDRWTGAGWDGRRSVAQGDDLLVNWADYPSVVPLGDGALAAHWMVRGGSGGEDYGIRVSTSSDDGWSWDASRIPHDDQSPTAHGFASLFPLDGNLGLVWLDGRGQARTRGGGSTASSSETRRSGPVESGDVSLWFRSFSVRDGSFTGETSSTPQDSDPAARSEDTRVPAGSEILLDARTCECCDTDVAVTAEGPVVVYRDRSPNEARDIRILRRVDGGWKDSNPVHDDGWIFPACPINGPAVDARGRRVAVAWFTAADDQPRVRLAFSSDAGASFDRPIRIDDGNPSGRVDVVLLPEGSAVVSWLERTQRAAELRIRRVEPSGEHSGSAAVGMTGEGQASGFPQMVAGPSDDLIFAWTDSRVGGSRVRLARVRPSSDRRARARLSRESMGPPVPGGQPR